MTGSGASAPSTSSSALPTGTVTFVFTDIEGSTRILKRRPDDAADLFERHSDIVRAAMEAFGGHVLGTEGDAFVVAFDHVDQAVAASARVQRELHAEEWPPDGEIRVRIGLHAGVAMPRNDNYVALAVHQAARVVNAAHGGQIVATRSTLDRRRAPAPVSDVPLGRYRVRDFDEPVELIRLDAIGAAVNDRPMRVTPADGHNLVRQSTSFVGRRDVLDRVTEMLSQGFIASVVGPGGIGKTRLAVEIGFESVREWPDGVWFVELADVTSAGLVAPKIADAVGLSPSTESDLWLDLERWAGEQRCLLVVDNAETCLDACADVLPRLAGAGAAILVTSREPLNVPAEVVWRLDALDVAPVDAPPDQIASSAAVALFVDRASAVRPDLDMTPYLADIAGICRRLDGLPLAIEIAAARVAVLTVPEILEGLDDRFALVRTKERRLPERHRTLLRLLQGSYDLLEEAERTTLRRLGVFAGSFTLRAAAVVVAGDIEHSSDDPGPGDVAPGTHEAHDSSRVLADDVAELVWSLVDKSLVVIDQSVDGTRYRLLESVREFALALLVESGEADHALLCAGRDLIARVGPWRPPDRRWLGEVDVELANLRGLIGGLADTDQQLAQTIACTIAAHHDATQQFVAGTTELTDLSDRLVERTPVRPVMLAALADLHLRRGSQEEADRLLGASMEVRDSVGTPPWSGVAIERTRGEVLLRRGDHAAAARLAREALERDLSVSDGARMWNLLGIAHFTAGDLVQSEAAFRRELEAYTELELEPKVASANGNVAELALRQGDTSGAALHQLASLDAALVIGQPVMLAFSAVVASRLAVLLDQWAMAVRLQSAAIAGLDAAGHRLYDTDAEELERVRADAEAYLDPDELAAEVAAGAALDSVQAAALTRRILEQVIAQGDVASARPTSQGSPPERSPIEPEPGPTEQRQE